MSFLDAFGYLPDQATVSPWAMSAGPVGGPDWTSGFSPVPLPGSGSGPAVNWSTEGAVGSVVNPLNPTAAAPTEGGQGAGSGDTDVSATAAKKKTGIADALKGLKAPAPPQAQTVRSPAAPQQRAVNSTLATLLAAMGLRPDALRLGQTIGRG